MTISVAMATHDTERYLAPLLASLAAQEHPPHELVVCDDASTDGTVALLEAFAAEAPFPVRVHPVPTWRGHVESFLDAARRCTGEAVAFCDADDVWRPDKLAICARALRETATTLVLHTTSVVDDDLRELGRHWPAIDATEVVPALGLVGLDLDAPGMAMVFRRDVLDAAPWADRPPSRYGGGKLMLHDEWVFFLAGVLGPIQLLAEPLLQYRQHGANHSGGWVDRRRQRTLRGATEDYAQAAEHMAACSGYLERAAAAGGPAADRFTEAAGRFARMSEVWSLRAALYAADERRTRARALQRLVAERAYRPRRTGGFGRAALGKDLAGVALRSRSRT